MSFSLDVKEELARVNPMCSHCNRALLSAYARMAGVLHMQRRAEEEQTRDAQSLAGAGSQVPDTQSTTGAKSLAGANFSLEMSSDIALVARLLMQILHEDVKLQTEITMRRSVLHKNVNCLITIPSQPHLMDVLHEIEFFGVTNKKNNAKDVADGKINGKIEGITESKAQGSKAIASTAKTLTNTSPNLVAKKCCSAAFVRGAFLASGFVSDPKSNAHFEITFENEAMAENVARILEHNQIPARVKSRRASYIVYLKSGEHIVNFLSFTGAHTQALKLENARVMKSVRSGVNRQINAELANQKKAAVAAVDQVFAARAVIEHYGAGKLTPALQEFIRLRIKYPNASLKELGEHATPPLSKSAMAHRVRRMMQLAQNIKD